MRKALKKIKKKDIFAVLLVLVFVFGSILFFVFRDKPDEGFLSEAGPVSDESDKSRVFDPGSAPVVVLPKEQTQEPDLPPPPGEVKEPEEIVDKPLPQETIPADNSEETGEEFYEPSDEEVFSRLFPGHYIDYLSFFRDELINVGYLKPDEYSSFNKVEDVVGFLGKGVAYLQETGDITQDEYEKLNKGIQKDFNELIRWEFSELKKPRPFTSGSPVGFNARDFWPPPNIDFKDGLCSSDLQKYGFFSQIQRYGLVHRIWSFIAGFGAQKAQAICFQEGVCIPALCPTCIPMGFNGWAPCCWCMCGKFPCGCLNAVCVGGCAIWDPMTGICGCGRGL